MVMDELTFCFFFLESNVRKFDEIFNNSILELYILK